MQRWLARREYRARWLWSANVWTWLRNRLRRRIPCFVCDGTGSYDLDGRTILCTYCDGTGWE